MKQIKALLHRSNSDQQGANHRNPDSPVSQTSVQAQQASASGQSPVPSSSPDGSHPPPARLSSRCCVSYCLNRLSEPCPRWPGQARSSCLGDNAYYLGTKQLSSPTCPDRSYSHTVRCHSPSRPVYHAASSIACS